jgi:hypothetical protein
MSAKASLKLNPAGLEDLRLNYNPEAPQERFKVAGVEAANLSQNERLPSPVQWPAATKPTPIPLNPAPAETDDLSRFHGYDAVVVTWTAAEAAALAALFTPGYLTSAWYDTATMWPLTYRLSPAHKPRSMTLGPTWRVTTTVSVSISHAASARRACS